MGRFMAAMMLPVTAWVGIIIFGRFLQSQLANNLYRAVLTPAQQLFSMVGVDLYAAKLDLVVSTLFIVILMYLAHLFDRR